MLLLGITDEQQPCLVLIDEWHYSSAEHHGETLPDVELSRRFRDWLNGRHGPEGHYVPHPEFVFLDPSAASMRAQLHADKVTSWAADNTVLDGIADVANLLAQGSSSSPTTARRSSPRSPSTSGTRRPATKGATRS